MDELESWLTAAGLEEFAPILRANHVDLELLPELSEEDLDKLGLSLGQRKKLLRAVASLPRPPSSSSAAAAPAAAPPSSRSAATSAERRQLTVLFCDLVGSTELSCHLDPEDLRKLIGTYRTCAAETMAKFGGFVAQYLGDGLLVYFGYPTAREDDPERAVRAGLEVVSAVEKLREFPEWPLQARVGIATGLVVVGEQIGAGDSAEHTAVGQTPNLAARMQALAQPGEVVIAAGTLRLIGRLFECEPRGTVPVKGLVQPVEAWRVRHETSGLDRFEALRGEAMTPFVGREAEIDLLLRRWQMAKDGQGNIILLSGEPGIGKSRLIAAVVQERIRAEAPHTLLRYFCSPYRTDSVLYPIVSQLEREAGFAREDTPATKLDKLDALLAAASPSAEDVTLLAELLSIPAAGRHPPLNLTPQRKKEKTLEALLRRFAALAREGPLSIVFEDVHWIDASSRELIGLAVEHVPRLPVFLAITFRPEFQAPPWASQKHVTTLALQRLDRREGAAMVERIARHKTLPGEILDQIVANTDGVPLFVEELTKSVLESGLIEDRGDHYALTGPLPPLAIPATLQDSLVARLDRMAPVKDVAQIAAVIGRRFLHDLLAAVTPLRERELQKALEQLIDAGLIFRGEAPQPASYSFKHALVRDAAYQTLLRSTRQHLHARIAGAIEERFPEMAAAEPEILAHHCAQAGLTAKAIDYRLKAGLRAMERSAAVEAVAQLEKGLELVGSLSSGSERDRLELALQVALAGVLGGARGYAAPEIGQILDRARELCERTGDRPRTVLVTWLKAVFHSVRAEFDASRSLGEDMRRLGRDWGDTVAEMAGEHQVGTALLFLGDFTRARAHLEHAIALYDPEQHRRLTFLYGQNPQVSRFCWLSCLLFALGYPEQALRRNDEALAYAKELGHFNTIAFALQFSAVLHQLRGDPQTTRERSEALISLCTEQRLFFWLATGHVIHGWALAGSGEPEAGLRELSQGIESYRATGASSFRPYVLSLRAAAHLDTGHSSAAIELLNKALSSAGRTGERWLEAELHRLRGECLLSLPIRNEAEAEASFLRALEIARRQSAKMWELRTASSLARLWRDQGKRTEARDLLAPIYAWFAEGFDTPDLRDASRMLDELRR